MTDFLWALALLVGGLVLVLGGAQWLLAHRRLLALDCGCPDTGQAEYGCLVCGHTRCTEHRYDVHDCHEKLSKGNTP